eukprot:1085783-Prymnesium_polylepis.1
METRTRGAAQTSVPICAAAERSGMFSSDCCSASFARVGAARPERANALLCPPPRPEHRGTPTLCAVCAVCRRVRRLSLAVPTAIERVDELRPERAQRCVERLVAEVANVAAAARGEPLQLRLERVAPPHRLEMQQLHAAVDAARLGVAVLEVEGRLLHGDAQHGLRLEALKLRLQLGEVVHEADVGVEHDRGPERQQVMQQRLPPEGKREPASGQSSRRGTGPRATGSAPRRHGRGPRTCRCRPARASPSQSRGAVRSHWAAYRGANGCACPTQRPRLRVPPSLRPGGGRPASTRMRERAARAWRGRATRRP